VRKQTVKSRLTALVIVASLGFIIATQLNFHRVSFQRTSTQYSHSNTTIEWLQPAELKKAYPNSIANNAWSFDFSRVENQIWMIKFDQEQKPVMTSQTAKTLERIAGLLPENLDAINLDRLALLVQKSVPGERGKSLATLLTQYYFYQQDHDSSIQAINSATGAAKLALLRNKVQLMRHNQTRFFGDEVASQLFKQTNARADFLNAMRVVNLTPSLSSEEKAALLSELRRNYKQQLAY